MAGRQRIHAVDFSGNLLAAIAEIARSKRQPQLLRGWKFRDRRAHFAARKTYEYLAELGEYELEFAIILHRFYGESGDWSEMISFEESVLTTLRRNPYETPWEFEIHVPGDFRVHMREDGAIGTEALWLKCAEIFIEAYQGYVE